jgi:hypothetical protein
MVWLFPKHKLIAELAVLYIKAAEIPTPVAPQLTENLQEAAAHKWYRVTSSS